MELFFIEMRGRVSGVDFVKWVRGGYITLSLLDI